MEKGPKHSFPVGKVRSVALECAHSGLLETAGAQLCALAWDQRHSGPAGPAYFIGPLVQLPLTALCTLWVTHEWQDVT